MGAKLGLVSGLAGAKLGLVSGIAGAKLGLARYINVMNSLQKNKLDTILIRYLKGTVTPESCIPQYYQKKCI